MATKTITKTVNVDIEIDLDVEYEIEDDDDGMPGPSITGNSMTGPRSGYSISISSVEVSDPIQVSSAVNDCLEDYHDQIREEIRDTIHD